MNKLFEFWCSIVGRNMQPRRLNQVYLLSVLFISNVQQAMCLVQTQQETRTEPPFSNPPKLETQFAADFSRKEQTTLFVNEGKKELVDWKKGYLILKESSVIQRKIDAAPWLELTLKIQNDATRAKDGLRTFDTWFHSEKQKGCMVRIYEVRTNNGKSTKLKVFNSLGEIEEQGFNLSRKFRVLDCPLDGTWTIQFRYSLITVKAPTGETYLAASNLDADNEINRISFHAAKADTWLATASLKCSNSNRLSPAALQIDRRANQKSNKAFELMRNKGDINEAIQLAKSCIQLRESSLGKNHSFTASAHFNLGNIYHYYGQYQDAIKQYEIGTKIRKRLYGKSHHWYAHSLESLGQAHEASGNYQQAERNAQKVLEIRRKIFVSNHFLCAQSESNLAIIYEAMGEYQKAEPLYLSAIKTFTPLKSIKAREYAIVNSNLAFVYYKMGQFNKAKDFAELAKSFLEEAEETDDLIYAQSVNNLALIFYETSRKKEALELFTMCLEILEKNGLQSHPHYATTLDNIASIFQRQGKFDEAELAYQKMNELRENSVGRLHPYYAAGLSNLGNM